MSLIRGEYVEPGTPDDPDREVIAARGEFLDAVEEVFPRFLERLREFSDRYDELARETDESRPSAFVPDVATPDVRRLLEEWAREFNVEGQKWIVDGAIATLELWRRIPELRQELSASMFRVRLPMLSGGSVREVFQFRMAWVPEAERWPNFRERATERLRVLLDEYETHVRAGVEEERFPESAKDVLSKPLPMVRSDEGCGPNCVGGEGGVAEDQFRRRVNNPQGRQDCRAVDAVAIGASSSQTSPGK